MDAIPASGQAEVAPLQAVEITPIEEEKHGGHQVKCVRLSLGLQVPWVADEAASVLSRGFVAAEAAPMWWWAGGGFLRPTVGVVRDARWHARIGVEIGFLYSASLDSVETIDVGTDTITMFRDVRWGSEAYRASTLGLAVFADSAFDSDGAWQGTVNNGFGIVLSAESIGGMAFAMFEEENSWFGLQFSGYTRWRDRPHKK